ncbi:hypothetical protein FB157_11158 [Streptomyces sp. BK340]|nr:hypothetical protein FB157_11158 [Streptomyces sp. BK340]
MLTDLAVGEFGRRDVLINNAGTDQPYRAVHGCRPPGVACDVHGERRGTAAAGAVRMARVDAQARQRCDQHLHEGRGARGAECEGIRHQRGSTFFRHLNRMGVRQHPRPLHPGALWALPCAAWLGPGRAVCSGAPHGSAISENGGKSRGGSVLTATRVWPGRENPLESDHISRATLSGSAHTFCSRRYAASAKSGCASARCRARVSRRSWLSRRCPGSPTSWSRPTSGLLGPSSDNSLGWVHGSAPGCRTGGAAALPLPSVSWIRESRP